MENKFKINPREVSDWMRSDWKIYANFSVDIHKIGDSLRAIFQVNRSSDVLITIGGTVIYSGKDMGIACHIFADPTMRLYYKDKYYERVLINRVIQAGAIHTSAGGGFHSIKNEAETVGDMPSSFSKDRIFYNPMKLEMSSGKTLRNEAMFAFLKKCTTLEEYRSPDFHIALAVVEFEDQTLGIVRKKSGEQNIRIIFLKNEKVYVSRESYGRLNFDGLAVETGDNIVNRFNEIYSRKMVSITLI